MFEKKLVKKLIFDEGEIETLIQENYKCIYRYCFYHVSRDEQNALIEIRNLAVSP